MMSGRASVRDTLLVLGSAVLAALPVSPQLARSTADSAGAAAGLVLVAAVLAVRPVAPARTLAGAWVVGCYALVAGRLDPWAAALGGVLLTVHLLVCASIERPRPAPRPVHQWRLVLVGAFAATGWAGIFLLSGPHVSTAAYLLLLAAVVGVYSFATRDASRRSETSG